MSSDGPDIPDRDAQVGDAPGPLEFEQPTGLDRYRKVRTRTSRLLDAEAGDQLLTAVVEVTEPGYSPPGLDVRGFITDTLLTCRVRPSALAELDQDPRVASIELGSQTDQID